MEIITDDLKVLRLVCRTTSICDDCPEENLCDCVYREFNGFHKNPEDWTDEDIQCRDL